MKVHTLLVDCDGVLTDGKLYIDHTGEKMFKAFHTRDVRAIREFVANGWEVVIISADDWPGGPAFAEKTGAVFVTLRDKTRLPQTYGNYVAVGDDAWDVPMLQGAVAAFAPRDCDQSVRCLPGITVLETRGGHGVLAELVRDLCSQS